MINKKRYVVKVIIIIIVIIYGFATFQSNDITKPKEEYKTDIIHESPTEKALDIEPIVKPQSNNKSNRIPNILILSSNPRSGTSLLGELMTAVPNATYFFEPIRFADKYGFDVRKKRKDILNKVIKSIKICTND